MHVFVCPCVGGCGYTFHGTGVEVRGQLMGLFFHYGVSEYQVVGLGGKHLFPLSQPTALPLAVLRLFL